ncbi:unnamed protein product [Mycena citricolor]|uniref:DUF6534 domain-containing protein n=1 Tax=Mycena citricolor TaxID=2018698 RepID=A0AAD2HAI2_9AGAR|nr:unnamed protein product [Mycena citricolor]
MGIATGGDFSWYSLLAFCPLHPPPVSLPSFPFLCVCSLILGPTMSNTTITTRVGHGVHGWFTVDNTLGAVVIGFAASCVVFGILLTQAWSYFTRFGRDAIRVGPSLLSYLHAVATDGAPDQYKLLVAAILLFATADQAFISHFVYMYSVRLGGSLRAVVNARTAWWSLILQEIIGSFTGTLVKWLVTMSVAMEHTLMSPNSAFASRVYRFSDKNIWITAFILLLAFADFAVSLVFAVHAFTLESITAVFALQEIVTVALSLGVLTDIVIALCLIFYLSRMRTGHHSSDSLVRRLVMGAISTGVLTSVVSAATLFAFDFVQHSFIFAACYFLLSKLYAVSFLATLNSRTITHERGSNDAASSIQEGLTRTPSRIRYKRSRGQSMNQASEVETNMFHMGTRLPSFYAQESEELPSPGYAYQGNETEEKVHYESPAYAV